MKRMRQVFFLFSFLTIGGSLLWHQLSHPMSESLNMGELICRILSISIILFIHKRFLFPKLLNEEKVISYFAASCAISILLSILPQLFLYLFSNGVAYSIHHSHISFIIYLSTLWIALIYSLIDNKFSHNNKKLEDEMIFLKNQIAPHFVFNALNNIYSLSLSKSDKAPESILKLSEILRYVFYESGKEKIPLEKEVAYLKNYISFQQYRVSKNTKIDFQLFGNFEEVYIIPMILINFIENAFKYGVSTFTNAHIDIALNYENGRLHLSIINDIFANTSPSHQVGVENSMKRLEYHYAEKYILESKELDDKKYSTSLKIELI